MVLYFLQGIKNLQDTVRVFFKAYPKCLTKNYPCSEVPQSSGSCPVLIPSRTGTCTIDCRRDTECSNGEKCCFNGCGMSCLPSSGMRILIHLSNFLNFKHFYSYCFLFNLGLLETYCIAKNVIILDFLHFLSNIMFLRFLPKSSATAKNQWDETGNLRNNWPTEWL